MTRILKKEAYKWTLKNKNRKAQKTHEAQKENKNRESAKYIKSLFNKYTCIRNFTFRGGDVKALT